MDDQNHHYVPQFYLRQWADQDGRVPHYRWVNGRAVFSRRAPEYIGYETNLYAAEHVPPEHRHLAERGFFSTLDDRAARIHARLVNQEKFTFTAAERTEWAIFLAAANARTPDNVAGIKRMTEDVLRKQLNENPKEVEKALGYKLPVSLSEWAEKHMPYKVANIWLRNLMKYLTRKDHIQRYMDMVWTVHGPSSRHKELLTCDRPLWYFQNPEHREFTVMMTLSPRTVFIATKNPAFADKLAATPSMRLARRINESVFDRAHERVYGRTTHDYATQQFKRSRQRIKRV